MDTRRSCVIAICTYQRVDRLEALLASIHRECEGADYRVVVVENDDSRSAESLVASYSGSYYAEPEPGISAARNKCLGAVNEDDDFLVFLDDDEVVGPGWLSELLRVQGETAAQVVAGPVLTVFPPNAPKWIVRGGFMQRRRYPSGTEITSVAAGNTLISTDAILRSGISFDPAFSFTGGEDTDYFRRMRPFTGPPVWADDAIVWEEAEDQRLKLAWLARRAFRNGSVSARIQLRTTSRAAILAHSVAAIAKHSMFFIVRSIRVRAPSADSFNIVIGNVGRMAAVFRVKGPQEYSR